MRSIKDVYVCVKKKLKKKSEVQNNLQERLQDFHISSRLLKYQQPKSPVMESFVRICQLLDQRFICIFICVCLLSVFVHVAMVYLCF